MSAPDWRVVKISPQVFVDLRFYFDKAELASSDEEIYRSTLEYAVEAFREDWEDLDTWGANGRIYRFVGDEFPFMAFLARPVAVDLWDFSILQETVEIVSVVVVEP